MEALKRTFCCGNFCFHFLSSNLFSLCALVEKYFAMDFKLSPLFIFLTFETVCLLLFFQLVITFGTFTSFHFLPFLFFNFLLNVIFLIQDPAAVSSSFQTAEKLLCADKSCSSCLCRYMSLSFFCSFTDNYCR